MPLSELWQGQSPTITGASLVENSILGVEEGYYTGASYEYINMGDFYVDDIEFDRDHRKNTISLGGSNQTKKIRQWRSNTLYNYTNAYTDVAAIDPQLINSVGQDWKFSQQMFGPTYYLGSSLQVRFIGLSIGTNTYGSYTKQSGFRNLFFQTKVDIMSGTVVGRAFASVRMADKDYYSPAYSIQLNAGDRQIRLIRNLGEFGVSYPLTSVSVPLLTSTDVYMRVVAHENRIFGFYQLDDFTETDYQMVGGTYYTDAEPFDAGGAAIAYRDGQFAFSETKVFTYDPIYTVNDLIKEVTYKAGLDHVHISDIYSDSLTSLTGFSSYFGGTWYINGDNELIGQGTGGSGLADHTILTTGLSFYNFTFEVDLKLGSSAVAGIAVGTTSTLFEGVNFIGISSNLGVGQRILGPRHIFLNSNSNQRRWQITPPQALPIANEWSKIRMSKFADSFYVSVNEETIYASTGASGFSTDEANFIGLIVNKNYGVSKLAAYRNLRVLDLGNLVPGFEISPNSNAESLLERLSRSQPFFYRNNGATVQFVPDTYKNLSSVRTYDIGNSHAAWDIYNSRRDTVVNHVIVYGAGDVFADSWDTEGYEKIKYEVVQVVSDKNLTSYRECKELADTILGESRSKSRLYSYENMAQIDLEKEDTITVINKYTGTSQMFKLRNVIKTYNPDEGDFTQTLTLEGI